VSAELTRASLRVENLSLRSRDAVLIESVSFTADTGRITWITGENGAGKSTLLRALSLRSGSNHSIHLNPLDSSRDIAYYAPVMGVPSFVTVGRWYEFNRDLIPANESLLTDTDPIVPQVSRAALMTRLSTGEQKRLLLWSLLRRRSRFTILDEPYEHLSPSAKSRLTEILVERSRDSVVVIATNQEVPAEHEPRVVEVT
jgi:ABC-2 type transport system ATP-binding protein